MRRTEDLLHYLGWNTQGDLGPWTFYTSQRKGLVFFQKAPPLEPPSRKQIHQRNKFRLAGMVWRSLTTEQRTDWQTAAAGARLQITGYNLFVYWITRNDAPVVETVERLSNVDLIPLQRDVQ
jgi:hypothetical protein